MTLTVGSLFSGIGGFEAAFEGAGFSVAWSVEIDKDCNRVLARHWPNTERFNDVRTVGRHNLTPVDVICGGWPCQDLSVAGKRAGLIGARSGLFYEAARIVGELKPALVLLENVPGLLSSQSGRDFAGVLLAFRELGARDICWRTLDAQHFGVPQRRRRIFLVADFGGERAGEILLDAASLSGNLEASDGTGARLARDSGRGPEVPGVAVAHTTGQGWWTEGFGGLRGDAGGMEQSGHLVATERTDGALRTQAHFDHAGDEDKLIAGPLTSPTGKGANTTLDDGALVVGVTNRGFAVEDDAHETLRAGSHGALPLVLDDQGGNQINLSEGLEPTLRSEAHGNIPAVMSFAQNQRGELRTSEVHPQSTAGGGKPGQGYPAVAFTERTRSQGRTFESQEEQAYALTNPGSGGRTHSRQLYDGYGVRRLTPMECERLQGFPDGHTAVDGNGKAIADSARYRMLGNAVTVSTVRWIADRMYTVMNRDASCQS